MKMRLLLQVPEGLKRKALEIARGLEKKGHEVIISAEPCFGACDLREREAKALGCKKIVHYGHTQFYKPGIPVEFHEIREVFDPVPVLERFFGRFEGFNSIGLVAALQFIDVLPITKKFLEGRGKMTFIGKGKKGEKKLYPGQILGCDTSQAKEVEPLVDCFLFIGSGNFHPLGLADKPVFVLDVERNEVRRIDSDDRARLAAVGLARTSHRFGILVSTKPGQMRLDAARGLKKRLEKAGKEAFLLVADEIRPEMLMGIDVDVWVNTACPRLSEDRGSFEKPIVNAEDINL